MMIKRTTTFLETMISEEYVVSDAKHMLKIGVGNTGIQDMSPLQEKSARMLLERGSGLTDNDFSRAVQEGISKVNIFTDINVAAVEAVKQETEKKMRLFSSSDRAGDVISGYEKMTSDAQVQQIVRLVVEELKRRK